MKTTTTWLYCCFDSSSIQYYLKCIYDAKCIFHFYKLLWTGWSRQHLQIISENLSVFLERVFLLSFIKRISLIIDYSNFPCSQPIKLKYICVTAEIHRHSNRVFCYNYAMIRVTCIQCVCRPGTSCHTGTVLFSPSSVVTQRWTTLSSTTRRCVLLGRGAQSCKSSELLRTSTAGHTSRSCLMTRLSPTVGMERNHSAKCLAATVTTHSRGSDLLQTQRTKNLTASFSRYEHALEVCTAFAH